MDYGTIKHKNKNTQLLSQSILHQYEGGKQRNLNIILDNIYPIGSIYLSIYSTNPSEYFGGTWEQLKDRFLVGAGDVYTAGDTGGSKNHTHSLDTNTAVGAIRLNDGGSLEYAETTVSANITTNYSITGTGGKGGSASRTNHFAMKLYGNTSNSSNMPPYLAVYMWKRIS